MTAEVISLRKEPISSAKNAYKDRQYELEIIAHRYIDDVVSDFLVKKYRISREESKGQKYQLLVEESRNFADSKIFHIFLEKGNELYDIDALFIQLDAFVEDLTIHMELETTRNEYGKVVANIIYQASSACVGESACVIDFIEYCCIRIDSEDRKRKMRVDFWKFMFDSVPDIIDHYFHSLAPDRYDINFDLQNAPPALQKIWRKAQLTSGSLLYEFAKMDSGYGEYRYFESLLQQKLAKFKDELLAQL